MRRRAEAVEAANGLSLDVKNDPLAYGDYDTQVDWRALPLLQDWHFDGMLVGSNAERDGFDFDADLLNVALAGPTPVRNYFGEPLTMSSLRRWRAAALRPPRRDGGQRRAAARAHAGV